MADDQLEELARMPNDDYLGNARADDHSEPSTVADTDADPDGDADDEGDAPSTYGAP